MSDTGDLEQPMSGDLIKDVNFGGGKDSIKAALESLKRNRDTMLEYVDLMATIRRKSYLSHIEAGFTKAESLELCKQL